MKKFGEVKEGDTLYIVYTDINRDYQIGEAVVVGFYDWTYEDSDMYSDEVYGEYPQTNILYRFKHLNFSRNLEYCKDDTHMTDCVEYGADHTNIINGQYIETFTTYEEAKEYVVSVLSEQVLNIQEQIEKLNSKSKKYTDNIGKINNENKTSIKYSMRNTEMEELAENIRKIELSDYNIQPLLHLYITVKRMISKKRPELLNIKVEDER